MRGWWARQQHWRWTQFPWLMVQRCCFRCQGHRPRGQRWLLRSGGHRTCGKCLSQVPAQALFSCDRAALWTVQSVRLSVCHTFLTMFPSSYHHEILRSYCQWHKWRPCKRSRSKVKDTEVTTQLNCFRTVTPVRIHIWWNDAYSLMMLRRGALLFFKVICQISRSHGSKNHRIWPRLGVSGL